MSPNLSTNHSSSPLSMIAQPTPTGISASTNRFKSPKMFRKGVSREEKEKDREKHRERETQRERQRQRERNTERETETERGKHRERETQRERQRQRDRDIHATHIHVLINYYYQEYCMLF